jgi:hypothetical protein
MLRIARSNLSCSSPTWEEGVGSALSGLTFLLPDLLFTITEESLLFHPEPEEQP